MALGLGERQRVLDAGGQPVGRIQRRVERARERVGRREADPVELADRVRLALQAGDRAGAEVARDAPGRRGVDAVRVEEQAQLAQLALVAPRRHRGAEPARPDPLHGREDALGIAVDRRQDLVGAEPLDETDRRDGSDMLDALEVGADRVLADRLEHAHALGLKLPAVAGVAAPAARDRDRLALAHVRERTDEHDLLALVGDRVEHGEVALGDAPAHPADLDVELGRRDVVRRLVLFELGHPASLARALDISAIYV